MSGLLAAGAAVAAVLAVADGLAALQAADPLGALTRWLAPARAAGRHGAAADARERRRLALLSTLVLAAGGRLAAGWGLAVVLAALGPAAALAVIRLRRRRWRRALAEDAGPACRALADALAGGAGVGAALATAAGDGALGPVARRALGGAAAAVALGAPLDEALGALARRAGPGPWEALVAAVLLQRRSGGDLARLLRDLAEHAEAGRRAEAEARDASAQARLTARIVLVLPVLGALLAEAAAPERPGGVLEDPIARVLIAFAAVLQVAALAAVRRIARVGEGMSGAALLAGLAAALGGWSAAELLSAAAGRRSWRPGRLGLPRRPGRTPLGAPPGLAARLAAAGVPAHVHPGDVMALKLALAAAVPLMLLLPLWGLLPGRLAPLLLVAGPVAGFLVPDGVLLRRARRRAAALRADAPDVLDRIRLAIEAGLPPGPALERAAAHGAGPLAAELRALAAATACGAPRAAALERLRARCPVPEVHALAAALARADRHGAPLGPALSALAAGARAERTRRIRARAQRAAPKIQLVVALLLVPAALLLIAAGLVAGLR